MHYSIRTHHILWAWGPVLVLMGLIFFTSAQPKPPAPENSGSSVYVSGMIPMFPGGWETLIKKGGHVLAYAALAGLTWRALRTYDLAAREAAALAILVAVAYAISDEIHQLFVLGRSGSVLDIGLDFMGAVVCVGTCWMLTTRRSAGYGSR